MKVKKKRTEEQKKRAPSPDANNAHTERKENHRTNNEDNKQNICSTSRKGSDRIGSKNETKQKIEKWNDISNNDT